MPLFPRFHSLDEESLPLSIIESVLEPSWKQLNDLGDDERPIPYRVQVFMTMRQALASQASAKVSPHNIRILGNIADASILSLLYGESPGKDAQSHGHRRVYALHIAAQLFLHIVIRQVPATSPLVRILRERLRKVLKHSKSTAETWASNYPTLLWISFVGILGTGAALESAERDWYTLLLRATMKKIPHSMQGEPCEQ